MYEKRSRGLVLGTAPRHWGVRLGYIGNRHPLLLVDALQPSSVCEFVAGWLIRDSCSAKSRRHCCARSVVAVRYQQRLVV
eukprot:scaffold2284_cov212-Ochromonas_danica.AAC.2